MSPIVERIARHLVGNLTESKADDLSVKLLKRHGLVPEGENPHHIVKGIAKAHGVPSILVPQMIHDASAKMAHASSNGRNSQDPEDTYNKLDAARKERWQGQMKGYAAIGGGEAYAHDVDSPLHARALFEHSADRVRQWHELASHPAKHRIVNEALLSNHVAIEDRNADNTADAEVHSRASSLMDRRVAGVARNLPHVSPHDKRHIANNRVDFDETHRRVEQYSPLNKNTWAPSVVSNHGGDGTSETHARFYQAFHTALVNNLAHRRGLNIPHKPDAEHTHEGVTYRGYTLDTPEKANAGCWGDRWCIATGTSASSMNEHYHKGTYKPTHVITKVTKGEGGKLKETAHAAYLPELLPGQKHEDPHQAVRNSGNNGPITGEDFNKIHPLLAKLDKRIDGHGGRVKHSYQNNELEHDAL